VDAAAGVEVVKVVEVVEVADVVGAEAAAHRGAAAAIVEWMQLGPE